MTVPENGIRYNTIASPSYSADGNPVPFCATANLKTWGRPAPNQVPSPEAASNPASDAVKASPRQLTTNRPGGVRNPLDVRDIAGAIPAIRTRERKSWTGSSASTASTSATGDEGRPQTRPRSVTFTRLGFVPPSSIENLTGPTTIPDGTLSLITADIPGAKPKVIGLGKSQRRTNPLVPDYATACSDATATVCASQTGSEAGSARQDQEATDDAGSPISQLIATAKAAQEACAREIAMSTRTGFQVGPIPGSDRDTSRSGIGFLSNAALVRSTHVRDLVREQEEAYRKFVREQLDKQIASGSVEQSGKSEDSELTGEREERSREASGQARLPWFGAEIEDALAGDSIYPDWRNRLVGPSSKVLFYKNARRTSEPLRKTNDLDDLPDAKADSYAPYFTGNRRYHALQKAPKNVTSPTSATTAQTGGFTEAELRIQHRCTDPLDPDYPAMGRPKAGLLTRPRSPTKAENISLIRAYLAADTDAEFSAKTKGWLESMSPEERKQTIAFAKEDILTKMKLRTALGRGQKLTLKADAVVAPSVSQDKENASTSAESSSDSSTNKPSLKRFAALGKSALWENMEALRRYIAAEHDQEAKAQAEFETVFVNTLRELRSSASSEADAKNTTTAISDETVTAKPTKPKLSATLQEIVRKPRLTQKDYLLTQKAKELAQTRTVSVRAQNVSTTTSSSQTARRTSNSSSNTRPNWEATVRASDIQLVQALPS